MFSISVYVFPQKSQLLPVSRNRITANQDAGVLREEFCMSATLPTVHCVAVCTRASAPRADVPLITEATAERIELTFTTPPFYVI